MTQFATTVSGTIAALALLASAALADPVGKFDVVGTNPDNGSTYTGTVAVERTGQTYSVVWDIAGQKFVGTGLGALVRDNRFVVGAAETGDTAISIGYQSGDSFGMAMYFEQEDGSWNGVWTYGGSNLVATETWQPR